MVVYRFPQCTAHTLFISGLFQEEITEISLVEMHCWESEQQDRDIRRGEEKS